MHKLACVPFHSLSSPVIYRRQQYIGKVRFSHFDTHAQSSKKVLLVTENNVFAALNTRTGDLCKYFVLPRIIGLYVQGDVLTLSRHTLFLYLYLFNVCCSLATCG